MTSRGFSPIFIVVLVVVFGFITIGWFVLQSKQPHQSPQVLLPKPKATVKSTNTPASTAKPALDNQTKAYHSLLFDFRYPKDWFVDQQPGSNGGSLLTVNAPESSRFAKMATIYIETTRIEKQSLASRAAILGLVSQSVDDLSVAGLKTKRFVDATQSGGHYRDEETVIFEAKQTLFSLSLAYLSTQKENELEAIFSDLLTSFSLAR